MIDYIAYIIVRLLNIAFSVIPIRFSLWLGRRFGTLAFLLNKKRRLVAYSNLKAAFAKEKSPSELKRITKRVYQTVDGSDVFTNQWIGVGKLYDTDF